MAPPDPDPLQDLRERLRAAQEAAERLAAGRVPRQGWAAPSRREAAGEELAVLAALLQALRDLFPAELQHQLADVTRQLLLVVRALIDWWVERLDGTPRPSEPDVEDIPIA